MSTFWNQRLERIENRQVFLKQELSALEVSIRKLKEEIAAEKTESRLLPREVPSAGTPPALPPPLPQVPQGLPEELPPGEPHAHPLNPLEPRTPLIVQHSRATPASQKEFSGPISTTSAPAANSKAIPEVPEEEGLELRLGKIWLVRLGVVILLTGMVFLANYTYANVIVNWGALPRALALFAGSGVMAWLGLQLEKRRPNMARFGQVLGAGGLAGVFYTLYASHYVEPLRWISSGILTGVLLLGWTACMAWIADRRKSQLLAGFSLLLAWYVCVITPVTLFLLGANLLLATVSVWFLLRNRWVAISAAALPVTYGAFAFWQYIVADAPASSGHGMAALASLASYWLVFTAAAFLARHGEIPSGLKTTFFALNNLAFFALGAGTFPALHGDWFWAWAMGVGGLYLMLAWPAGRLADHAASRAFWVEGLLLLTVGLLAKFNGPSLSVLLAVEGAILLFVSRSQSTQWTSWYRAASCVVAALALLTGLSSLWSHERGAELAALAVALLFLGQAWLARNCAGTISKLSIALTILAQLLFAGWCLEYRSMSVAAICLAAVPLVCAGTARWHRFKELPASSLLSLALSHLVYLLAWNREVPPTEGETLWLLLLTIALGQVWARVAGDLKERERTLVIYLAAVEVALPAVLLAPYYGWAELPLLLLALGMAFTLKGSTVGSVWSAIFGQTYLMAGGALSVVGMIGEDLSGPVALLPIGVFAAMAFLLRRPLGTPTAGAADDEGAFDAIRGMAEGIYRCAAIALGILWVFAYIDAGLQAVSLATVALGFLLYGQLRRSGDAVRLWSALTLLALCTGAVHHLREMIGIGSDASGSFAEWLALACILVGQHIARLEPARSFQPRSVPTAVAMVGLIGGFFLLSQQLHDAGHGLYMTLGWCAYGACVLGAGFINHQRAYRLAGLAVLGTTVLRLFVFDLWDYGTLARVGGFMALGIALIGVGFIYNRFSDAIRRYL